MDEGHHQEFATFLYNNYVSEKLSNERLTEIISEAVSIEKEFILESLPVKLIGINSDMMSDYIDYVADNIYNDLGVNKPIGKNPFKFMEKIAVDRKQNFFEKRVTEYQKADLNNLNFNEEF